MRHVRHTSSSLQEVATEVSQLGAITAANAQVMDEVAATRAMLTRLPGTNTRTTSASTPRLGKTKRRRRSQGSTFPLCQAPQTQCV